MEQGLFLIIAASLAIGLAAGFVMHRADFCTAASFRDLFLFRAFFLMRQMILLGLAARLAPSRCVWRLWSGLPILALQRLLFVARLVPGTWGGARLLTRFVIR